MNCQYNMDESQNNDDEWKKQNRKNGTYMYRISSISISRK